MNEFWGDYHTHTVFSHGKGQISDNAEAGAKIGLKQIAITDHGLGHIAFGVKRRELNEVKRQIEDAKEKFNIDVLMSVEANIISEKGTVDIKEKDKPYFDIVVAGFHKLVWPPTLKDWVGYIGGNVFRDLFNMKPTDRIIKRNTNAYVQAIKNYDIDIISHIGNFVPANYKEVAKVASDYGTLIELNSKRCMISDEDIYEMYLTGVNFVIDSDAHSPNRVGEFSLGIEVAERVGISEDRIMNYKKLPNFRSGYNGKR